MCWNRGSNHLKICPCTIGVVKEAQEKQFRTMEVADHKRLRLNRSQSNDSLSMQREELRETLFQRLRFKVTVDIFERLGQLHEVVRCEVITS